LRQDPASMRGGFSESQSQGICERHGNQVEICDRFWPYQKQLAVATSSPQAEFLRQVRAAFLAPACVRSTFTAPGEKLALKLGRNGVNLEHCQIRNGRSDTQRRRDSAHVNPSTARGDQALLLMSSSIASRSTWLSLV
jgi:hypothetical protein